MTVVLKGKPKIESYDYVLVMFSGGKDGRSGESYYDKKDSKYLKVLLSKKFTLPMIVSKWELPSGAYKKTGGPS